MSRHVNRFSVILLASVMAIAGPIDAMAARGGGGGHGGGGGGGHFGGGGGGHFGGGGGHFGGGGGGHFGGGGGGHFGGFHMGGGGLHFGGGGLRFGGSHGARSFAGGHALSGRSAGRAAGIGAGALATGALAHNGFAHNDFGRGGFGHDGFGRNGFGRNGFGRNGFGRNGFGRAWHRGLGGYGWAGPLFWPYAYDDIYSDALWGYGYDDPFWDYGYGDIYGGLFSPYGYDDLAGFLPGGDGGGGGTAATRRGQKSQPTLADELAQMCGDDTKDVAGWPIDRIQQAVMPNGDQQAALDELANASIKAAQIIKAACPSSVAFTPTGRINAMQARIDAMSQAVDTVRAPMGKFYGLLSDEQKARLNAAQAATQAGANPQVARGRGSIAQNCAAANTATQWPGLQIEKAVHPTDPQKVRLDALRSAASQAAEQLAASCPSEFPATPPARLAAIAQRLDVMRQAIKNVRAALDDFYGSLNDEQKAQFNLIGQPNTAHQG